MKFLTKQEISLLVGIFDNELGCQHLGKTRDELRNFIEYLQDFRIHVGNCSICFYEGVVECAILKDLTEREIES